METRLEEFVRKYFSICEATGKNMNGIDRAQFIKSLRDVGAENILEMLDTIEKYEAMKAGDENEKI